MATSPAFAVDPRAARNPPATHVRLSEVLAGLSHALDLTEGQRPGHAARTCLIGMRLARELGLPADQQSALFYALLMKDLGCSSNAARFAAIFAADDRGLKSGLKTVDWRRATEAFRFVATSVAPGRFWLRRTWQALGVLARGPKGARDVARARCERGAEIGRMLEFDPAAIEAIRGLDEHWDGRGYPYSRQGEEIPLLARIVGLAQTAEVFASTYSVRTAFDVVGARRGSWFDPALVDALRSLESDTDFWRGLRRDDPFVRVAAIEPETRVLLADDDRLDVIASAFARVIDAKSPWTAHHSSNVAELSGVMARTLGFDSQQVRELRRVALLHDLGKLGVSSLILDKPGRLNDMEAAAVQRHPEYTRQILARVECFRGIADLAASHHERLDGRGYHRHLDYRGLPMAARILTAADICDALSSSRPYRPGLAPERVLDVMGRDVGTGIDYDCFDAVRMVLTAQVPSADGEMPALRKVAELSEDYGQAA